MDLSTVIEQVQMSEGVARGALKDLTHEQSLFQPPDGGNCPNWILGHLNLSRATWLGMLGAKAPWADDKYARYNMGSEPLADGSGAVDFAEMVNDFFALTKPLSEALAAASPETLAQSSPFDMKGDGSTTVGMMMSGMAFHDAYHLGQIAILRRMLELAPAVG